MPDRDPAPRDHWDIYAETLDLEIEGHRLIALEIVSELNLLRRALARWLRDMMTAAFRRRSSPPV